MHVPPNAPVCSKHLAWRFPFAVFTVETQEGTPKGIHWAVAGSDHHSRPICDPFIPGSTSLRQGFRGDVGRSTYWTKTLKTGINVSLQSNKPGFTCLYVSLDLSSQSASQKPAALVLSTRGYISFNLIFKIFSKEHCWWETHHTHL